MPDNKYALITGASEGLGKALAFECASRKLSLVLVSLPDGRLHSLGAYLRANFDIEVHCIETDLTQPGSCRQLFKDLQHTGLAINILINNAGIGGTEWFRQSDIGLLETQIRLNVLATTLLSRLFIDELGCNGPGYLLNVSSLGCFFHLPKKNVYAGTKSFVYFLTRCLRTEMRDRSVSVSVLCPGGIDSNAPVALMNRSATWFARQSIMNPEAVACAAISGMLKGKMLIVPGNWNKLFLLIKKVCPAPLARTLMLRQMSRLKPDRTTAAPAALSLLRTG